MDELFQMQIQKAEERFARRKEVVEHRQARRVADGDWREIEDPQRVLRRMMSLGMHELAGEMMATDAPAHAVRSIVHPEQEIDLLERIIEENNLISSRFLHMGSFVARAVGRIHIRSRGRTLGYGTGFLISPRLLMTNNHVLPNASVAGRCTVEFDYYERANTITGPTITVAFDPGTFFLTDIDLDFTIVAIATTSVEGQPLPERNWIPLIAESGKALIGEPVNLIQHPGGEPQQIAIKDNEIVDVVDDFMHYRADTQRGSSGACVTNMQWELAALHHAGVPRRDEQGNILLRDGSIWNGSLATAEHIDWIANEGVRISSIVKAVTEAIGDEGSREYALFAEVFTQPPTLLPATAPAPGSPAPCQAVPDRLRPGRPAPGLSGAGRILDDEALDRLTPEEIAQITTELEDRSLEITLEAAQPGEVIVAEGDSWFDYSVVGLDIIDNLRRSFGYRIHNIARAGDTLDNMAYGTDYDKNRWQRRRPPLEETLEAVRRYQPRVVLLSAGGNDVAGDEFYGYLNHKDSGKGPLREEFVDYMIKEYFRRAYQHIFNQIWKIDEEVHIVIHGYGYAQPDGRGVVRLLGWNWVGPWLRPALTAKGYTTRTEGDDIVRDLIDRFNIMLRGLGRDDARGRIHYIDLRPVIQPRDWVNELHLKNSTYLRVAAEFDRVITVLLE